MKDGHSGSGTPFGRYQLLSLLGRGGMGEVYLALGPGVEGARKRLALKRMLPSLSEDSALVARFLDEARLSLELSHGNIVPVFEVGRIDSQYFLAMECVEGKDLRQVLERLRSEGRQLPIPLVLYIALSVSHALDYAHRKVDEQGRPLGLVHRDVSPQNVLLGFEGEVKLTDFGIARATTRRRHTATGALVGKFAYMSPEQAAGLELDGRSDQFSLGIVLYEMLTGQRLFEGDTDLEVLRKVQQAHVEPPSRLRHEVPPELEQVVLRALARDPGARHASMADMARALGRLLYQHEAAGAPELSTLLRSLYPLGATPASAFEAALLQGPDMLPPAAGKTASLTVPERPAARSQGARTRPWALGLAGLALVAALGSWGLASLRSTPPPPRVPQAQAPASSSPPVEPTRAASAPEPPAPQASPLPSSGPTLSAAGTPTVTRPSSNTSPRPSPASPAPASPAPASPAPASPAPSRGAGNGYLSLRVVPWGEIFVDGVKVAETSALVNHVLSEGAHTVRVRNAPLGQEQTFSVQVAPGERVVRQVELSTAP